MKIIHNPQDVTFWYVKQIPCSRLRNSIKANVVVIGGGIAGLSAAQSFASKGLAVVVIEKTFCGAGATGKSSGFITPASELSLNDLIAIYGKDTARKLWQFSLSGVHFIEKNIKTFLLDCDYQKQDTLVVSNTDHAFINEIIPEYQSRELLKYETNLYDKSNLLKVLNSQQYTGGVRYSDSFGIQAYSYCQEMKKILMSQGVQIYEESPAIHINSHKVETPSGSINADYIIICADRFVPELHKLTREVYHAQTFLMLSSPLVDEEIKAIFPDRPLMVWDTDLIYQYYRLNGDNRIMLGGATLYYTYSADEKHNNKYMYNKLTRYFKSKFPELNLTFEYIWPGLIGIAKDIMPIVGKDKHESNIYYACACAGLPWAAACGNYISESIINKRDDLNQFFSPSRRFAVGKTLQFFIGTKASFALSNILRIKRWA